MPAKDQMVNGYTFVEPLGEGGQADVWLAEKRTSVCVTQFAVKVPRHHMGQEQVRKEIESWSKVSRLGHPNLLPLVEAFEKDGQLYLVSEYVPKGTLKHWLESKPGSKAESVEQALVLIEGVLAGVEVLHKDGLTHKDLKPANIAMLGELPRIMDYGLSRWQEGTLDQSTHFGTLDYMPPEGFKGERSHQWDVWAIGVMLQELLTGQRPFLRDDDDRFSVVNRIKDTPPLPLPATVPSVVRAIVTKALEKDRKSRYRSAAEMRQAVLAAQNHLQTQPEREARQLAKLAEKERDLALAEQKAAEKLAQETIQNTQNTLERAKSREREAQEREQQVNKKLAELEDDQETVARQMLEAKKAKKEAEQALEKSKADSDELQALRDEKQTHQATQAQLLQVEAEAKRLQTEHDRLKAENDQAQKRIQAVESQVQEMEQEARDVQQTALPPFFGPALALVSTTALVGGGTLGFAITSVPLRVSLEGLLLGSVGYVAYCHLKNKRMVQEKIASIQSVKSSADQSKFERYLKAAEVGSASDMNNLGDCYYYGTGVTKDYTEAVKWFRKAAAAGDSDGMSNLGWMYKSGNGIHKDYVEAVKWYRKAIEAGNAQGMNGLGNSYYYGNGVPKDYDEAFKWYSKAAEAGDCRGMNNLGEMYRDGEGVAKNLETAKEWFRKAARAGSDKAKENLKRLGEKI